MKSLDIIFLIVAVISVIVAVISLALYNRRKRDITMLAQSVDNYIEKRSLNRF